LRSKTKNLATALALCAALASVMASVTACSPERDPATLFSPEAVGTLVVNGVLMVGEPLPIIRLTRTQEPDLPFNADSGVALATMSVTFNGLEIEYRSLNQRGEYFPFAATVPLVEPETKYDLMVTTSEGESLSSSTTTPQAFDISQWVLTSSDGQSELRSLKSFEDEGDQVYFHPDNQLPYGDGLLDARFVGIDATEYGAFGFQLAIFSIDFDSELVVDPPFFDEEDLADLPRLGSSPILEGSSGQLRLPWFAIYFGGRHLYKINAVDRNWFDLVRSVPVGGGSFGPGGNVGEGADTPIFHVNGGIGLFGSGSVDSTGFFILPATN
jgi:hypothetical protein